MIYQSAAWRDVVVWSQVLDSDHNVWTVMPHPYDPKIKLLRRPGATDMWITPNPMYLTTIVSPDDMEAWGILASVFGNVDLVSETMDSASGVPEFFRCPTYPPTGRGRLRLSGHLKDFHGRQDPRLGALDEFQYLRYHSALHQQSVRCPIEVPHYHEEWIQK